MRPYICFFARTAACSATSCYGVRYWTTTGTMLPVQKFEQPIFDRPEKPRRSTGGKKCATRGARAQRSVGSQEIATIAFCFALH